MKRKLFSLALVLCMALTMAISLPAMAEEPVELVSNPGFEGVAGEDSEGNPITKVFNSDEKTPVGWRRSHSTFTFYENQSAIDAAITADTENKIHGGMYVDTNGIGHNKSKNCLYFYQAASERAVVDFHSQFNKTYKVSMWIKAANTTASDTVRPTFDVGFFYTKKGDTEKKWNVSGADAAMELYKYFTPDEDGWLQYTAYLTVPDAATLDTEDESVQVGMGFTMPSKASWKNPEDHTEGYIYDYPNFYLDDVSITEYCDGKYQPHSVAKAAITAGTTATINTAHGQNYISSSSITPSGYSLVYAVFSNKEGNHVLEGIEINSIAGSDLKSLYTYTIFSGPGAKGKPDEGAYWTVTKNKPGYISVPSDAVNPFIKVFVWDSINGMSPLGDVTVLK